MRINLLCLIGKEIIGLHVQTSEVKESKYYQYHIYMTHIRVRMCNA